MYLTPFRQYYVNAAKKRWGATIGIRTFDYPRDKQFYVNLFEFIGEHHLKSYKAVPALEMGFVVLPVYPEENISALYCSQLVGLFHKRLGLLLEHGHGNEFGPSDYGLMKSQCGCLYCMGICGCGFVELLSRACGRPQTWYHPDLHARLSTLYILDKSSITAYEEGQRNLNDNYGLQSLPEDTPNKLFRKTSLAPSVKRMRKQNTELNVIKRQFDVAGHSFRDFFILCVIWFLYLIMTFPLGILLMYYLSGRRQGREKWYHQIWLLLVSVTYFFLVYLLCRWVFIGEFNVAEYIYIGYYASLVFASGEDLTNCDKEDDPHNDFYNYFYRWLFSCLGIPTTGYGIGKFGSLKVPVISTAGALFGANFGLFLHALRADDVPIAIAATSGSVIASFKFLHYVAWSAVKNEPSVMKFLVPSQKNHIAFHTLRKKYRLMDQKSSEKLMKDYTSDYSLVSVRSKQSYDIEKSSSPAKTPLQGRTHVRQPFTNQDDELVMGDNAFKNVRLGEIEPYIDEARKIVTIDDDNIFTLPENVELFENMDDSSTWSSDNTDIETPSGDSSNAVSSRIPKESYDFNPQDVKPVEITE